MNSPMFSPAPGTDGRLGPTPNPQETVAFKFGDKLENGWASDDNPIKVGYFVRRKAKTIEMTDGKGKFWEQMLKDHKLTKLAEPHVVQSPQEGSPGFEAVLNSTAIAYMESKGIEIVEAMHQLHPNFTEPILAAHQKEIQLIKREMFYRILKTLNIFDTEEAVSILKKYLNEEKSS